MTERDVFQDVHRDLKFPIDVSHVILENWMSIDGLFLPHDFLYIDEQFFVSWRVCQDIPAAKDELGVTKYK